MGIQTHVFFLGRASGILHAIPRQDLPVASGVDVHISAA